MAHKAHILIADEDQSSASAVSETLRDENYHTVIVSDGRSLKDEALQQQPDVILIGHISDGGAVSLVQGLRQDGMTFPVLVYHGDGTCEMYEQAAKVGVDEIMEGLPPRKMLLARLPLLVRMSTMQAEMERRIATAAGFSEEVSKDTYNRYGDKPFQVMYVCPSKDPAVEKPDISKALIDAALSVRHESNVYHAGNRLGDERFEACVIRVGDADELEACLYLCSQVRDNPRLFNLPVLIAANEGVVADEGALYEAGATVVMAGGLDPDKIASHVAILVARQRFKWNLRDPMLATLADGTGNVREGTYSAEFFLKHLSAVLDAAKKRQTELTVCVYSIHNLPEILDRYGEDAARILMRQMASWIKGLLRLEDLTARLSDTEFGVILPDTHLDDARSVANRIVGILHHSDFRLTDEIMEAVQVSVRLGIADYQRDDDAQSLMARAQNSIT